MSATDDKLIAAVESLINFYEGRSKRPEHVTVSTTQYNALKRKVGLAPVEKLEKYRDYKIRVREGK